MRPYGWTADNKINRPEAVELRRMARHIIGGGSLHRLVADLAEREVATVGGKRWQPVIIKRALTNPRIIGHKQVGEKLVPVADIPPILRREQYELLVEILHDPDRQRFSTNRVRRSTLLSDLVTCGNCGTTMSLASTTGRTPDYSCSLRSGGCATMSIRQHIVDADATERLLARLSDRQWRRQLGKQLTQPTDYWEWVITDARARIVVLAEEFGAGDVGVDALRAGKAAAEDVIAGAERNLELRAATVDLPDPTIEHIAAWWEDVASLDQRRTIAKLLIEKITVAQKVPGEERLTYTWR